MKRIYDEGVGDGGCVVWKRRLGVAVQDEGFVQCFVSVVVPGKSYILLLCAVPEINTKHRLDAVFRCQANIVHTGRCAVDVCECCNVVASF